MEDFLNPFLIAAQTKGHFARHLQKLAAVEGFYGIKFGKITGICITLLDNLSVRVVFGPWSASDLVHSLHQLKFCFTETKKFYF